MTRDFWRRSWEVYEAASQLPSSSRSAYIESEVHDPEMRNEVLAMIAELETPGSTDLDSECSLNGAAGVEVAPLQTGELVGRFEIKSQIGRGGIGQVYLARDPVLERDVAVKVLHTISGFDSDRATDRVLGEARAASALNHPNMVTVYEVVRDSAGAAIVMEFVPGRPLRSFCGAPASMAQVAVWGRQIADALATAHSAGIIHRDIKPENIMVRADDYVKVLDFGLAMRRSAPVQDLPMGTVRYMSPEQSRAAELTTSTDVFSLGVVLYELVTGAHPFASAAGGDSTLAVTESIAYRSPRPAASVVRSVPRELDQLLREMLAKDPKLRPSAREVADRLGKLVDHKRRLYMRLSIAAGALAVVGFLAAGVFMRELAPRSPQILRTEPFTNYEGTVSQPDFSPDGSRIVFAWTGADESNQDIYWQAIGETSPHRLTTNPAEDFYPVYSPDGKWIAFLRHASTYAQVVIIPADGGAERIVGQVVPLSGFVGLAWWPDGQSLLVRDALGPTYALVRLMVKDGSKVPFTSPAGPDADSLPKLSPDLTRIAFGRYNTAGAEICWKAIAGGAARCVARVSGLQGIAWHHSGRFLYFADDKALWRVGLFGDGRESPIKIADGMFDRIAADKTGKRLAYCRTLVDANIWSTGRHGENPRRLIASSGEDSEPAWSPDGSRIVIRSNRSGAFELYTYNADGTGERQITHFGAHVGSPRWSPDGKWIAFDGNRAPVDRSIRYHNIYVVPSGGGAYRRITDDSVNFEQPTWSPDGQWIYYLQDSLVHQTRKSPLAGGPSVYVGSDMVDRAISPDAKFFYYTKDVGGPGIWRRPVEGGSEVLLPGTSAFRLYRYWDYTQGGIFFVDGPPNATIRYLNFETNQLETVATLPSKLLLGPRGLAVAPDGQSIVYSLNDVTLGNISLLALEN